MDNERKNSTHALGQDEMSAKTQEERFETIRIYEATKEGLFLRKVLRRCK